MRPICFMVMPFGVKAVTNAPAGAPTTIDFDSLWLNAYQPALEKLGYDTVRADQDSGALIIHEMLERLYFSDLVLADMTIPNGNVYYEIGIRHASKQSGCVLISADWATPLFDTHQMRRICFDLKSSSVSGDSAKVIENTLVAGIPDMKVGESPMFTVLPGYPEPDAERATTMQSELRKWSSFQTRLRILSREKDKAKQKQGCEDMISQYRESTTKWPDGYVIALLQFIRDHIGWSELLDFIELLPEKLQDNPLVKEQSALAISKTGNHNDALAALEMLIELGGESSERRGLIGGRYKRLADAAKKASESAEAAEYLDQSIDAYERGTALDLADYYCLSNLARLYRERDAEGDEQRALSAIRFTVMACEIAMERNPADQWVRPTLLGAAFDSRDVALATHWCKKVKLDKPALWQSKTTNEDLRRSAERADEPVRTELLSLVDELAKVAG